MYSIMLSVCENQDFALPVALPRRIVFFTAVFFGVLRLQRRKKTVFYGKVSETCCSKPCIGS